MKLNKKFIGINYALNPAVQKAVIRELMDPELLGPILELTNWTEDDIELRRSRLENLHLNDRHRLFYITKNVQQHSELISFDKIKLSWFKNVKSQRSTYMLGRNEFFRFVVNEGKEIYALHFYQDPSIPEQELKMERSLNVPLADFYGYKFDTFIIYINHERFPDGFIPDNKLLWGQDPENHERFLKLMLFIELSEPEIHIVKDNGKVKLVNPAKGFDEGKIKNESGLEVTLVNTLWNKIVVRDTGFSVRGHIRIQPYGPGREHYKPIWIDEFQKSGYIRGLDKINESNES